MPNIFKPIELFGVFCSLCSLWLIFCLLSATLDKWSDAFAHSVRALLKKD